MALHRPIKWVNIVKIPPWLHLKFRIDFRLAEEAKWCLDNSDSCWKRGLDEETIRAVSKFNITDIVMRRFGNH